MDQTDVYVARLLADGTLDAEFGGGEGFVQVPGSPDKYSSLYANAVDSDGKIILSINEYDDDVDLTRFVRLNADGTPDSTFGTAGEVVVDLATGSREEAMYDVLVLPDGKLFFCGYIESGQGIYISHFVRLNNNGSFDNTYDGDGKYSMPVVGAPFGAAFAMERLPDNKIAVAGGGFTLAGAALPYAARLGTDGKPDPAFGQNGRIVYANLPFDIGFLSDLAIMDNGKWLIGGSIVDPGSANYYEDLLLIRLNANGSLDQDFAGTGYFTHDAGDYEAISKLAVGDDNKVLIAGYTGSQDTNFSYTSQYVLGRVAENGTLDPDFNGGIILGNVSSDGGAYGVSIQPDGKILISGYVFDGSQSEFFVTRFSEISGSSDRKPVLSDVSLFPNPAADHTFLDFNIEKSTGFSIQLVNLEGKVLASLWPFTEWSAGEHQLRLNLPAGLPAGAYQVVLQGKAGLQNLPVAIR